MKLFKSLFVVAVALVVMSSATLAAFTASATITSNTFTTGTAALQFWSDLDGIPSPALVSSLPGGSFTGIYPNWTQDYLVKVQNTGTVNLMTSVTGVYVSDTTDLRNHISVQAWLWNDADNSGTETGGDTYTPAGGPMSLETWRSVPINLTQVNAGGYQGVLLRFTADDLSNAYQGQTTVFDFRFDGTTTGTTQATPSPIPTPIP